LAKLKNVVGIRLTDEEIAKLDRLADETYRGRADVLRYLIAHTRASKVRDLTLDQEPTGPEDTPVADQR